MGIKYLNGFLRENSPNSIKCINMTDLSGKKIAVDISIYMYKFEGENSLIENMYLMLSIFRYYNITPIFIFDGKPPAEKKELLIKRKEDKMKAEKEYNVLKTTLASSNIDDTEKQEILNNMDELKKKFVYINKEHINQVKILIRAYGATYYDAPGEADELCAMLAIEDKVWGCLSEDMDMFVYGCPRVLRYFSLMNHTAVVYELKGILLELGITLKEFKEICVLSGTDYNMHIERSDDNPRLHQTLKLFKKYHKSVNPNALDFYDWLLQHSKYITNHDLLKKSFKMFDLSEKNNKLQIFEKIKIMNGLIVSDMMRPILEEVGFIFPPLL